MAAPAATSIAIPTNVLRSFVIDELMIGVPFAMSRFRLNELYVRTQRMAPLCVTKPPRVNREMSARLRAELASGGRRDGRTGLLVLLDFVRGGDALVVNRPTQPLNARTI
jgi:hypothetical protein